ncbi:hypothetical protein [Feifania hominis]|uniref:DUF2238 domain-containing protein n=1 Tax=Feifania hominis TaxID=2763660 RepID=A0A926DDP4_9FIRM|nr:hypothetical protein [Feifania hominis]MBC8536708.1 hypothetical protein [Feifania hominis]
MKRFSLKILLCAACLIRAAFVVTAAAAVLSGHYTSAAAAAAGLALSFSPAILKRRRLLYIPVSLQLFLLLFLFCTLCLGEYFDFYYRFWWWDLMLHGVSGLLFGVIGFLVTFALNRNEKIHFVLSPFYIAFFAVCFSTTIGVVWEFFEFAMDGLFAMNMQKSGLVDTMKDLAVDFLSSFLAALSGYLYLVRGESRAWQRFLSRFIRSNRRLFRRHARQAPPEQETPAPDDRPIL